MADPGYSGDGGPATNAQLYDPSNVFVDSAENVYIADTDNCLIREVSGSTISTVAGNPLALPSPCGYSGDGGPAKSAQLGVPEGLYVVAGNIFIADTDNNLIRVVNNGSAQVVVNGVSIPSGYIQTVAGNTQNNSACGTNYNGTPAVGAQLCFPSGVFVDGSGNLFIADTDNFVISEAPASSIVGSVNISAVVGTIGVEGYSPNGTPATSAELNYPNNIVVDAAGDIFIADTDNFVLREVATSTGKIATVVGNNTLGYSGDGQPPVHAELNYPGAVSTDSAGDLFIADTVNSVIREVSATNGIMETVVGNGTECSSSTDLCGDGGPAASAQLYYPYGLALDAAGNIFIADTEDNRIRVVNTQSTPITIAGVANIQPGYIATVAGTGSLCADPTTTCGDGPATSAELSAPYAVFVDSAENIFIADTQDYKIREVAADGVITTVAGNGTQCLQSATPCGDNGAATSAQLSSPTGVFVDLSENIYIADTFDNRVRAVNPGTQAATVAGVTIQSRRYCYRGRNWCRGLFRRRRRRHQRCTQFSLRCVRRYLGRCFHRGHEQ